MRLTDRRRTERALDPVERPQTAAEVIVAIESRGGRLWLEAGRVRFQVPQGRAVSIETIRALKRHEPELIARLSARVLEVD